MSFFNRKKQVTSKPVVHEVSRGRLWGKIKEKVQSIGRTDYGEDIARIPHPASMDRYDELCKDPTVAIAISTKTNMVIPDFYFEMPEEDTKNGDRQKVEAVVVGEPDQGKPSFQANIKPEPKQVNPNHPNKLKLEEWKKQTKAVKKTKQIVRLMLRKGFCPVQIIDDYNLKILSPNTFYRYQNKAGNDVKYTQERTTGNPIAIWQGKEMDDIILFINEEDIDHPYGQAEVDTLETLLDTRKELNEDMGKIIKRFSAPFAILRASGSAADVKKNILEKDIDEILFLGNTNKDEVELLLVEPNPQVKFLPYIDSVDFQIGQKLNAPLILLLKNANEASAKKMMDAIDRWVQSTQNEIAEILEERIYKKIIGSGPVPVHRWGAPREVLDDITLTDIASLTDKTISKRQAQDLIRKKGIELIEDEDFLTKPEPSPFAQPFGQQPNPQDQKGNLPFQKNPQNIPLESVERLNDLGTALDVIEAAHKASKISLVEACKLADRTIAVHMKRLHGEGWKEYHDVSFQTFIQERLVPQPKSQKQTFKVEVD